MSGQICIAKNCHSCSNYGQICEDCKEGYFLEVRKSYAGWTFTQCRLKSSGCVDWSNDSCVSCSPGYNMIEFRGLKVCSEDYTRHFYYFLGFFLFFAMVASGFVWWVYKTQKKNKKESKAKMAIGERPGELIQVREKFKALIAESKSPIAKVIRKGNQILISVDIKGRARRKCSE
jgi:cbb3-type cytochrome oxidase subunit 3